MGLDLSAGSLIRSGSGLLFVALGLALLATMRRREPRVWGFAVFAIPFGAAFVLSNLLAFETRATLLGEIVCYLLAGAGLVAFLIALPGGGAKRTGLLSATLAVFAMWLIEFPAYLAFIPSNAKLLSVDLRGLAIAVSVGLSWLSAILFSIPISCVAVSRRATPNEVAGMALLSSAFSAYVGVALGHDLLADPTDIGLVFVPALPLFLLIATAVGWLWITARTGGTPARNAALIPLAAILIGLLPHLAGPEAFKSWGTIGIARIVAWSILVYGIVRLDILDLGLRQRSIDRSALAAGALALLFIVAQIGQNFLSAQYGLLMGGVVAGAFLFAAQPLQRALDRVSAPRVVPGPGPGPGPGPDVEDVYRSALRIALVDRVVTREEELHLAELGERLGLPARRALELRHEVEREPRGSR